MVYKEAPVDQPNKKLESLRSDFERTINSVKTIMDDTHLFMEVFMLSI